jgi:transcriptional regulator with XRE-family HTH domain
MLDSIEGVGAEIRRLRVRRGWSAARLSREAHAASVHMIERGERTDPRLSQMVAIAQALGTTVDAIVERARKDSRRVEVVREKLRGGGRR